MSALGQKQTFRPRIAMSALPPEADMCVANTDVRFVPIADIRKTNGANRKTALRQSLRNQIGVLIRPQQPSASCASRADLVRRGRRRRGEERPGAELL
jgi:hypothetical protein